MLLSGPPTRLKRLPKRSGLFGWAASSWLGQPAADQYRLHCILRCDFFMSLLSFLYIHTHMLSLSLSLFPFPSGWPPRPTATGCSPSVRCIFLARVAARSRTACLTVFFSPRCLPMVTLLFLWRICLRRGGGAPLFSDQSFDVPAGAPIGPWRTSSAWSLMNSRSSTGRSTSL